MDMGSWWYFDLSSPQQRLLDICNSQELSGQPKEIILKGGWPALTREFKELGGNMQRTAVLSLSPKQYICCSIISLLPGSTLTCEFKELEGNMKCTAVLFYHWKTKTSIRKYQNLKIILCFNLLLCWYQYYFCYINIGYILTL